MKQAGPGAENNENSLRLEGQLAFSFTLHGEIKSKRLSLKRLQFY